MCTKSRLRSSIGASSTGPTCTVIPNDSRAAAAAAGTRVDPDDVPAVPSDPIEETAVAAADVECPTAGDPGREARIVVHRAPLDPTRKAARYESRTATSLWRLVAVSAKRGVSDGIPEMSERTIGDTRRGRDPVGVVLVRVVGRDRRRIRSWGEPHERAP